MACTLVPMNYKINGYMGAPQKPCPRYLGVVVWFCVNLPKLEQCFSEFPSLFGSGLGDISMVWKVKQQPCLYSEGHREVRCCSRFCTFSQSAGSSHQHGSSWVCSSSCWILLLLQLLDKEPVCSTTKGPSSAHMSPASSALWVWRWFEISACFTASSWVLGYPCFLSVSVRIPPERQDQ